MKGEVIATNYKPRKWYNGYKFPLIPIIQTRDADEHNTWSFSFHWLFFQVWSLDAFHFEIAFVMSEHWGIGITALLPYLRLIMTIPFPEKLRTWVQRNLWRKPLILKTKK